MFSRPVLAERRLRVASVAPTIDAVTQLMLAAGLSTAGERPPVRDIYEKPADPPQKPAQPRKP